MGRRPRNTYETKQAISIAHETAILTAASQYRSERDANLSPHIRKLARQHNIPKSTLHARISGRRSIRAFNASKKLLTTAEELNLCDWALHCAERGQPVTSTILKQKADAILRLKYGPETPPTGKNFIGRLRSRYPDKIKKIMTSPLPSIRAAALNPRSMQEFFSDLRDVYAGKHSDNISILPENIYAMDETGIMEVTLPQQSVFAAPRTKIQHRRVDGTRENTTVVVTICADGVLEHSPLPMVIFKATHWPSDGWGIGSEVRNPQNLPVAISPHGYIDADLMLMYMKQLDSCSEERAEGRYRVLVYDGHKSHLNFWVIDYAIEHKIILICYPPHTTHAVQGLDVVLFSVFKRNFVLARDEFLTKNRTRMGRKIILRLIGPAYTATMTSSNIISAFKTTGVWPLNPDMITPSQMAPSLPTSITEHDSFISSGANHVVQRMIRLLGPKVPEAHHIAGESTDSQNGTPDPGAPSPSSSQMNFPSTLPHTPSPIELGESTNPAPNSPPLRTPSTFVSPSQSPRFIPISPSYAPILDSQDSGAPTPPDITPRTLRRRVHDELASESIGQLVSFSPVSNCPEKPYQPVYNQPSHLRAPNWNLIASPTHSTPISYTDLQDENQKLRAELALAHVHSKHDEAVIQESNIAQYLMGEENLALRKKLESQPEEKKRGPRLKNAPRVLTTTEYHSFLKAEADAQAAKEVEARRKKSRRVKKKLEARRINEAWAEVNEEYRDALKAFEKALARWKALPKHKRGSKPVRPKRSQKKKDIVSRVTQSGTDDMSVSSIRSRAETNSESDANGDEDDDDAEWRE